ncbi:MAG: type IX secretion system membrane protein PorP/SprF, partial [Flavobacteriales bacterium]|nr:type IX secretion system membrane protein PorP/SprF [Flavobacteriales bacterium]
HYMYNTLSVNPGYAGSRDAMSILALGRFQWVGLDGAPMTQTFQVHSPIARGLCGGISFLNDKIGPTNNTHLVLDLAYRFNLGKNHRLSIGMKGGFDFLENRLAALNLDQQNDPMFTQNFAKMLPNAGIGLYYDHTNFYVGFSIPKLVEHRINGGNADIKRHYFFILGGYIPVARNFDLKPTALVKVVPGAPIQGDVTLEAIFTKRYSAGVFYRSLDGVGAILGVNVMPNFRIGYSFDWPLTELSRAGQYGSHEIMLRYDLKFGKMTKIVSPRHF